MKNSPHHDCKRLFTIVRGPFDSERRVQVYCSARGWHCLSSMMTTRTKVSKSSKAIAMLIKATFPEWTGRKVTVIEAAEGWEHTQYVDDQTSAVLVNLETLQTSRVARPSYSGGPRVRRAIEGSALVMLSRFMGKDVGIEIIIPAIATRAELEPAVDAMLLRQGTARVLAATVASLELAAANTYARTRDYAGIMVAVVEADAKTANQPAQEAA